MTVSLLYSAFFVNSTPTSTARAELHSMVTSHHANTRGSRAGRLRIAHLCLSHMLSTCHVSFLAALGTHHKHKFSATRLTYLSHLSDGLTFTSEPCDPRPTCTLRCSTAEWRINTNRLSHTRWEDGMKKIGWGRNLLQVSGSTPKPYCAMDGRIVELRILVSPLLLLR